MQGPSVAGLRKALGGLAVANVEPIVQVEDTGNEALFSFLKTKA